MVTHIPLAPQTCNPVPSPQTQTSAAVPHVIRMELGQLDPTAVSIQIGHTRRSVPVLAGDSVPWEPPPRPTLRCWALSPVTGEAGVSSPRAPGRMTQGAHGGICAISHMQRTSLTGLRERERGVSVLAGIKAEISRYVRGRVGGGRAWPSSLWCDAVMCYLGDFGHMHHLPHNPRSPTSLSHKAMHPGGGALCFHRATVVEIVTDAQSIAFPFSFCLIS